LIKEKIMSQFDWFVVIAGLLGLWIAFSPDSLADAARVSVFKMKSWAQRKLEDAVARGMRAVEKTEAKMAKAKADLLSVKKERRLAQNKLEKINGKISELNTAADNAASIGRTDLVEVAEKELAEVWEPQLAEAQPAFDFQVAEQERLESVIEDFEKILAVRKNKVSQLRTRAASARTRRDVNAAIADLNPDGTDDEMKKAFDTLEIAEAEADVMTEEADKVRLAIKQKTELEQLSKGPVASVEERIAARMKKFNKENEAN
jgi:phage shock protein A